MISKTVYEHNIIVLLFNNLIKVIILYTSGDGVV